MLLPPVLRMPDFDVRHVLMCPAVPACTCRPQHQGCHHEGWPERDAAFCQGPVPNSQVSGQTSIPILLYILLHGIFITAASSLLAPRCCSLHAPLNPILLLPALLCPLRRRRDETFFESCGVADLIATCYGGRNRLVAKEFVAAELAGAPASFAELEVKLLNGQKLQGVLTSNEVQAILFRRNWEKEYPLFTTGKPTAQSQAPLLARTNALHVCSYWPADGCL